VAADFPNFYRRAELMNAKLFLAIFVAAFALIPLSDPIFSSLEAKGVVTKITIDSREVSLCTLVQFAMFLVMGFSIWPVMVRVFIFLQIKIGNAELPLVKFLQAHEQGFIFFVWCMLIFGLCIALPGSVQEGFFD
jgi:hypothetical protein